MPDKLLFQSPEDVAPQKTTVVLYGPAGSGKTTFSSTFPGPYYLVPRMSSNEMKTLRGLGMKSNILVFDTITDMHAKITALADLIKSGSLPQCKTVVFDNLTSAQLVAEAELLERTGKHKLEWEEWNEFTALWKNCLLYLHDLPVNVVWITHSETVDVKPNGGGKSYTVGQPTLVGKSRRFIPSYADMFLYCDSADVGYGQPKEFYVHLKQRDVWPARARENKSLMKRLPDYIGGVDENGRAVDPTYDELARLMGWDKPATKAKPSTEAKESNNAVKKKKKKLVVRKKKS